ncbi:MAG: pyridoxal phosphate-dependent aminotransferase family protein [Chitinophagales bacterium]|nr:pyridoxal phosphate-dependent aminotransferase family protein [Chitinophagales bacterium]
MNINQRIQYYLEQRKENQLFRKLTSSNTLVDFSSNDYLGFAKSAWIKQQMEQDVKLLQQIGSTGSRLLNGNHTIIEALEQQIANFHYAEAALFFNSGYNANVGLISTVARKEDIIIYDEKVHASIHVGMQLSKATLIPFKHNNLNDLSEQLLQVKTNGVVFVIVETMYSMDGDIADLKTIAQLCKQYQANLIIDEAHSIGLFGEKGRGLANEQGVEQDCFARVYTYGKALGSHGAAVAGSQDLQDYLINFAKPFIYSTAPLLLDFLSVKHSYNFLQQNKNQLIKLNCLINYFKEKIKTQNVVKNIKGIGPIFLFMFNSVEATKKTASFLQAQGLDCRAIVYPTVAQNEPRIRIVLHSYNTTQEIDQLIELITSQLQLQ